MATAALPLAELDAALRRLFTAQCAIGDVGNSTQLSSTKFVKLLRDASTFDKRLSKTDAELIFVRAAQAGSAKGGRSKQVAYPQFLEALYQLAAHRSNPADRRSAIPPTGRFGLPEFLAPFIALAQPPPRRLLGAAARAALEQRGVLDVVFAHYEVAAKPPPARVLGGAVLAGAAARAARRRRRRRRGGQRRRRRAGGGDERGGLDAILRPL